MATWRHFPRLYEYIPARYVLYLMLFFSGVNIYAMRANINVAMIAMVKARPPIESNSTECPVSNTVTRNSTNKTEGEFDWDEQSQGIVLSSFYWGYVSTAILGGFLSHRYSGKWVAGIGILSTAFITFLSPVAARAGIWYLVASRVLEGLTEGVVFPALYTIVGKWVPPSERSSVNSLVFIGDAVGTAIVSPVSAVLFPKELDNGWPLIFYCFGCMGVLWFVFWAMLVFDSPEDHPGITKAEQIVIIASLNGSDIQDVEGGKVNRTFPWISVAKSGAIWGVILGAVGQAWGYFTQLTLLPTYMKSVLHFNINQSALYSIIPHLTKIAVGFPAGFLVDFVMGKNILTVTKWRKIAYILADLVPGALLISIPFIGCDKLIALAIFSVVSALSGLSSISLISFVDIAPNFAGPLCGIISTFATLPAILAPYVAGYLTNGNSNVDSWSTVFYISAAFNFGGTIFFLWLNNGKLASWNFTE